MDIRNRSVLILGGWGLVGSAICRKLMEEEPKRLIITSLHEWEAMDAVHTLRKEYPKKPKDFFTPWWGNIFVRHQLKDLPREEILSNEQKRAMFIDDLLDELTTTVLERSSIFQLVMEFKPDIIIDCINSATAIAYQDIFNSSRNVRKEIEKVKKGDPSKLIESTERLLATLYIPQLIRHVQILYRSMQLAGVNTYLKIGTSGTGGMGLNIPYTHSEERPSSVLLSKSSVAGAHTLLLFLMGRTPDAPITKEIKPTAAIAWKRVAYGEIKKHGKPIELVDCPPKSGVLLNDALVLHPETPIWKPTGKNLQSVFADTGENGMFSRMEYEAICTPGQMEFVTPEEIAESAVYEIKGGNTGHDIINALDNASLNPTYRAGFMFEYAMRHMTQLEKEHDVESVAFEILGPPRLSKLLYEAYLLKKVFKDMKSVLNTTTKSMSKRLTDLITKNAQLRAQIISIGIPILLPDGKTLLRGREIKIPPFRGNNKIQITPQHVDAWTHDGWVDLRETNMEKWQKRFKLIIEQTTQIPRDDTSSRFFRSSQYWDDFKSIQPGKLVGWIFGDEEKGARMKA
jgi:hypothetical protein